ncbi:hypothetical protein POTOM_019633 [Populus tomentosa]|uniref:Uncharacterized protein n=1 Tax=Populus tomentosa TaxID=118781 RepID=A0A8X7ZUF8_POPTO|nr:hypothetical protein POTOM_019633 [Populus tomentosa]
MHYQLGLTYTSTLTKVYYILDSETAKNIKKGRAFLGSETERAESRVRKDSTQGRSTDGDEAEFRRDRNQDRSTVQTQERECFSQGEEGKTISTSILRPNPVSSSRIRHQRHTRYSAKHIHGGKKRKNSHQNLSVFQNPRNPSS